MKKMKKMMALVIAVVMMMAMTMTTMAASIDVTGVKKGETYTAYKLLNYTAANIDPDAENDVFSYYLTKEQYDAGLGTILTTAGFGFTESSDGSLYYVNNTSSLVADDIVEKLNKVAVKEQLGTKAIAKKSATASEDGTISIASLDTGYYFIDSSLGSLCELRSYDDQDVIFEKNSVPSIDKKQCATQDGTYVDSVLDFNIGDTVYYQVEVKDGKGTNQSIVITDEMAEGLKFKSGSISVTKDGSSVTDYTVTDVTDQSFKLTLDASYVETLQENEVVLIKYQATVNEKAVVDSANTNSNTATLKYSEQTISDPAVYVATYDFNLNKTDGTNTLSGAKFKLYDAATGGNEITLAKDATGYYVSSTDVVEIEAGIVNIRGLKPGTYYLEETEAPAGYNKLDAREAVTITSGAIEAVEVEVENQSGSLLPETGGIGTTIFYAAGALLVISGVVVLVTRKRMENQ